MAVSTEVAQSMSKTIIAPGSDTGKQLASFPGDPCLGKIFPTFLQETARAWHGGFRADVTLNLVPNNSWARILIPSLTELGGRETTSNQPVNRHLQMEIRLDYMRETFCDHWHIIFLKTEMQLGRAGQV